MISLIFELRVILEIPETTILAKMIMHIFHIQYTLANPNRGVPIQKISVPITEFVRISEIALVIWRINNTKICGNPLLLV